MAGNGVQVVEGLPGKLKVLGSNPTKLKKKTSFG
jgi:hypothetical protein